MDIDKIYNSMIWKERQRVIEQLITRLGNDSDLLSLLDYDRKIIDFLFMQLHNPNVHVPVFTRNE